jgi:hypothetical protein
VSWKKVQEQSDSDGEDDKPSSKLWINPKTRHKKSKPAAQSRIKTFLDDPPKTPIPKTRRGAKKRDSDNDAPDILESDDYVMSD